MPRRDAHLSLAQAYGAGVGDAILLAKERVASGQETMAHLWPFDGTHPDDPGYALFADAAWEGFEQAVRETRVCHAPPAMRYADTYLTSRRVRLSSLGPLPAGWRVGAAQSHLRLL